MKKRLIAITLMAITTVFLTACWSEKAVETEDGVIDVVTNNDTVDATEAGTEEEATEAADIDGTYVRPMPFVFDLANPTDATLASSFSASDINMETGEITFKAYSLDVYDAVQITMLQIGDTLLYDGREIVVENIEDKSGELYINGGLDGDGCVLTGYEGGTYVARMENDYPTYTEIGTLTLTMSESTRISDSISDPSSPKEIGYDELQSYIDGLSGSEENFTLLNTTVEISGGKVVNITRVWTP